MTPIILGCISNKNTLFIEMYYASLLITCLTFFPFYFVFCQFKGCLTYDAIMAASSALSETLKFMNFISIPSSCIIRSYYMESALCSTHNILMYGFLHSLFIMLTT
jgi:hypothetical protein